MLHWQVNYNNNFTFHFLSLICITSHNSSFSSPWNTLKCVAAYFFSCLVPTSTKGRRIWKKVSRRQKSTNLFHGWHTEHAQHTHTFSKKSNLQQISHFEFKTSSRKSQKGHVSVIEEARCKRRDHHISTHSTTHNIFAHLCISSSSVKWYNKKEIICS